MLDDIKPSLLISYTIDFIENIDLIAGLDALS